MSKYRISKKYLKEHYVKQGKSASEICRELDVKSETTIYRALEKYDIPRRTTSREGRPHKTTEKFGDIHQSYLCLLRIRARNRKLAYNLSGEYLWELFLKQDRKCALSGQELFFPKAWGVRSKTDITASLDRIDSTKGYIVGNVQWVHKTINVMKMDMSDSEFINICKMVANNDNNIFKK